MTLEDSKERQYKAAGDGSEELLPVDISPTTSNYTPLSPPEYQRVLTRMSMAAELVKDLPLQRAITTAKRADTLGPVLDPTLWMQANQKLGMTLDLLENLLNFQTSVVNWIAAEKQGLVWVGELSNQHRNPLPKPEAEAEAEVEVEVED